MTPLRVSITTQSVDALDYLIPAFDQLAPAEPRVAPVMAQRSDRIIRSTLISLARKAGVSEPTVLRFYRTIGVGRLKDLKIELARSLLAADAQHKPFRLGIAAACAAPNPPAMSAATLGPDAAVRAISQTGSARDVIATTSVTRQHSRRLAPRRHRAHPAGV